MSHNDPDTIAAFAAHGLKAEIDDKGDVRYVPLDGPAMRLHKKVKRIFPSATGCKGCEGRARRIDAFIKGAIKNATPRQVGKAGPDATEKKARAEPPPASD